MTKANIFTDLRYNAERPLTTLIQSSRFVRDIRIALHSGTEMKKHSSPHPISVELLEGELDFMIAEQVHPLEQGDILHLEPNIPHSLTAHKHSIVRLTILLLPHADKASEV